MKHLYSRLTKEQLEYVKTRDFTFSLIGINIIILVIGQALTFIQLKVAQFIGMDMIVIGAGLFFFTMYHYFNVYRGNKE